jgi:hypothetical protein
LDFGFWIENRSESISIADSEPHRVRPQSKNANLKSKIGKSQIVQGPSNLGLIYQDSREFAPSSDTPAYFFKRKGRTGRCFSILDWRFWILDQAFSIENPRRVHETSLDLRTLQTGYYTVWSPVPLKKATP